jgi:hypothetical protein
MLFRETVAVYCEKHNEYISTEWGQNAEILIVKASGIFSYRCALEG